jgi:hypothetical protein
VIGDLIEDCNGVFVPGHKDRFFYGYVAGLVSVCGVGV